MLELSRAILKADVFESVPPALIVEIVDLKDPTTVNLPGINPVKILFDKPVK